MRTKLHGFWFVMPFCWITSKFLNESLEVCLSKLSKNEAGARMGLLPHSQW